MSRAELLSLPAARDQAVAERDRVIAQLRAEVAEPAVRLARLERLISRNSGNSSFPPSMDDQPGRKPPADKPKRGRGKRRPGKQPGATGSRLAWSKDPDRTVPHFPEGPCGCGARLEDARDLGIAASHQQAEIPLASATVIQHYLHAVTCACGKVHQAARPAGAGARARSPTALTCKPGACS